MSIPSYGEIPLDVLRTMAQHFNAVIVSLGTVLIQQGDILNSLYYIEDGNVEVSRQNPVVEYSGSIPITVYSTGPNAHFGSTAIFAEEISDSSVLVVSDTATVLTLTKTDYDDILNKWKVRTKEAAIILGRYIVDKIPIFKTIPPDKKLALISSMDQMTFRQGTAIKRQGTVSDSLHIIADGECTVTVFDPNGIEHTVATLRAGDYFGVCMLFNSHTERNMIPNPVCHNQHRHIVVLLQAAIKRTFICVFLSPSQK